MLLIPIVTLYTFGHIFDYPINLLVGVVNDEVDCTNFHNFTSNNCDFNNLSCKLINEIEELKVVHFKSLKDALESGKDGKLLGILHFKSNFSEILEKRQENLIKFDKNEELHAVDFYPDNSDYNFAYYARNVIFQSINNFKENCSFFSNDFLVFEKPIFDNVNSKNMMDIFPSFLYGYVLFKSHLISHNIIITFQLNFHVRIDALLICDYKPASKWFLESRIISRSFNY